MCGSITTQRLSGFNKLIFTNGNKDQKCLSGNPRYVKIRLKRLVMLLNVFIERNQLQNKAQKSVKKHQKYNHALNLQNCNHYLDWLFLIL